jgi:hypothetical protein
MEEESANELQGVESHRARTVSLGVILPTKGDFAVFEGDEPPIGDGDSMSVSGEVLEDLLGTAEGRTGILPIITTKKLSSLTHIIHSMSRKSLPTKSTQATVTATTVF